MDWLAEDVHGVQVTPADEPYTVGDYVSVQWIDSGIHIDDGWAPIAEYIAKAASQMGEVETVGTLIGVTDDALIVGLSVDGKNDTVFGAQVIMRSNITVVSVLH